MTISNANRRTRPQAEYDGWFQCLARCYWYVERSSFEILELIVFALWQNHHQVCHANRRSRPQAEYGGLAFLFIFFYLGKCRCHINAIGRELIQTNTEPLEGVYILAPQAEYVNMRTPTQYLHRLVSYHVSFILIIFLNRTWSGMPLYYSGCTLTDPQAE